MDFIAGVIVGLILMMAVTTVLGGRKDKKYQQKELQYIEYIKVLHDENCQLTKDREWWKREAINNAAMLGEKLIEESKELCARVDKFMEDNL